MGEQSPPPAHGRKRSCTLVGFLLTGMSVCGAQETVLGLGIQGQVSLQCPGFSIVSEIGAFSPLLCCRQGPAAPTVSHPVIFLFTGEQGEQYGYSDEFQTDGTYWYTGEGQVGDM